MPRPSKASAKPSILAYALGLVGCVTVGVGVAQLTRRTGLISDSEKTQLRAATNELRARNQQLTALYNVFSEITGTLSLRYVIAATLRETIKIMDADFVVLRSLQDGMLAPLGTLTRSGQEIEGLYPVGINEGYTGQVAREGKPLRLDRDAETSMHTRPLESPGQSPSQQMRGDPLQSGIITPLIVGTRVVGTLSCWSTREAAFTADDERIMDMMASQVATAIVAASSMEESEHRAHHDALTDLPNRFQLSDDLKSDLRQMQESGARAAVVMADIDHFKKFNDSHGHKSGDIALQKVASVLRGTVRDGDRVYRYGGEEFVLIFADVGTLDAQLLSDRLRLAVQETELSDGDSMLDSVTISLGVAMLAEHGTDVSQLIDLADAAMYRAKALGRNRVVVWAPESGEDEPDPEKTAA